ncbi:MAG: type II toxin-antitoxin system RelE/ParE family toxin [Calditrichaceae bacterium]|nr:type II toxin-antitoxin system RelE/ParE family toxin [Calditrichaceae bacterium]MBN2709312.1 type II toxin-antitoxin system RelE/ParE family toxin [Calditrichaceae bacterium]RQV94648.1 MAG: type II toxin-antitoxin system RelE/ParE family toxin [Calditrichota bacterium]
MNIRIDKSFEKDTNKITNKTLLNKIADCIEDVKKAKKLTEIKNFKKLKAFHNIYRIRLGDYRLGILVSGDTVEFIRCLHRKDIYNYFPK